jgi:Ca2+-binding RTX toxin-like protein
LEADSLDGGTGNNRLAGIGASDSITGGKGADCIKFGTNTDTAFGGPGDDACGDFQAIGDDKTEPADFSVVGVMDLDVDQPGANTETSDFGVGAIVPIDFDSTHLGDAPFDFS